MFIDEFSACHLRSLSFLGNGQKEHPLFLRHLIVKRFIGVRGHPEDEIYGLIYHGYRAGFPLTCPGIEHIQDAMHITGHGVETLV